MKDFWAEGLENQRKEKIKKFLILLSVILVLVGIVVIILCYIYYIPFRNWCDNKILKKEILQESTKSIELDGDENTQIYAYDKYICLFRKKNLEYYNKVGTKIATVNLDINQVSFTSAGRYMAIGEKSGTKFYLICGKEILFNSQVDGTIKQINVSKDGYVSVVISNANYKSIVIVYNKNGKEIFKTNLVTSRVADVSISQDSKYLAIAEIDISGILIKSSIQIVSIELAQTNPKESIIYKYEAPTDKLILNIEYQTKNQLVCMYNNSIDILQDQNDTEIINFENKKLSFMTIGLNNRVAYLEEISTGEYTSNTNVNIINPNTRKSIEYVVGDVAKAICTSDNKIAINFGTELHIINKSGFLIKKYISETEINEIVMTDSLIGVVYRDKIQIINL